MNQKQKESLYAKMRAACRDIADPACTDWGHGNAAGVVSGMVYALRVLGMTDDADALWDAYMRRMAEAGT